MADSSDVDTAIINRLAADPTLRALLPHGVFWDVSKLAATKFTVVSQLDHDDRFVLGGTVFERFLYLVKGVALGQDATPVRYAAHRIKELLDDQRFPIAGYVLMNCQRVHYVRVSETIENTDDRWFHRGGHYEVLACPWP
jgi:hypothetical protein